MLLTLCWPLLLRLSLLRLLLVPSLALAFSAESSRATSNPELAVADLLSQMFMDAANSTASNASSMARIQSFVSVIVLATLAQHNDSSAGALPPLKSINELLRRSQGANAMQLEEQVDPVFNAKSSRAQGSTAATAAATEFSTSDAAAAADQTDPLRSFGYRTSSDSAARIHPALVDTPFPPPPTFAAPAFPTFAADPLLLLGSVGSIPSDSDLVLEAALRGVRAEVAQVVYSLLRAASFQINSLSYWIQVVRNNTVLPHVLRAVGNQIGASAFYIQAARFTEATEAAIQHLQRVIIRRQTQEAQSNSNGTGTHGNASTTQQSQQQPEHASPQTPPSSGFPSSLFACPSFLYGSWLRVETGSSSSPSTAERVVLRFAPDGVERLEVFSDESSSPGSASATGAANRQRSVQHQRWSGSMRVQCYWTEAQEAEAAAAIRARASTASSPPASLRSSLHAALSLFSSSPARIVIELMQSGSAARAVVGGAWGGSSGLSPAVSMHFTFLSLSMEGVKTAVLVERLAGGDREGTEAEIKHGHAFMRMGDQL